MSAPASAILIGAGGWGRNLLVAAGRTESLKIAAAVDPALPELGIPVFASLEEALGQIQAQAVVIAIPNHLHLAAAKEAAAKGLHVFVDKPIARTVAEGEEMVRICREAGLVLMVGHNTRRHLGHRWLNSRVKEGDLGDIVSAEAAFSHAGLNDLQSGAWRSNPDACPAVGLTQLGVHFADTLIWMLGEAAEVKSLFASVAGGGRVQDSTHALIRFKRGTVAVLSSNYSTPYTFRIALHGTKGMAEVNHGRHAVLSLLGQEPVRIDFDQRDTLAEELDEFAFCVREGVPPETMGEDGVAALAVIEAAIAQAPRPGVKLGPKEEKDPLAAFLDHAGRLTAWPSAKKRDLQLRALARLAERFEPGARYSEAQVNAVLRSWHTFGDWALLRRELVDSGLLCRTPDVSSYWRAES